MGLSFGSKRKWSSESTATTNSTTTPTAPDWASNLVQGAAGRVGGLPGQGARQLGQRRRRGWRSCQRQ